MKCLTSQLLSFYNQMDPNFFYSANLNPRRVLTKPSAGFKNDGFDNSENDYILHVNDIIGDREDQKFFLFFLFNEKSLNKQKISDVWIGLGT